MATVQEGVSNLKPHNVLVTHINHWSSPQLMKSNCLAFNYSFSVRDSMEGWREAVLAVDAFLGWKQVLASFSFNPDFSPQEWHPAAIAGTITAVFLTIWYTGLCHWTNINSLWPFVPLCSSDPSLLTLLATIGLLLTLADFIGPKVGIFWLRDYLIWINIRISTYIYLDNLIRWNP